jgi:hypothetical protein
MGWRLSWPVVRPFATSGARRKLLGMHPRTQELLAHVETCRTTLRSAVEAVPVAFRGTRPAPDRWSVADVLDHLGLVEARTTSLLSQSVTTARAKGLRAEPDTSRIVHPDRVARIVNRQTRFATGQTSRPRWGIHWEAAWQTLEGTRVAFRDAVIQGDGLALGDITHPHPALGPLTLYEWIVFIGGHEARHAEQIKEIGQDLGN